MPAVLHSLVIAAAGGGSSGFSGGGGGGGGGGFSGGGGYSGGGGGSLSGGAFLVIVAIVLVFVVIGWIKRHAIAAAYRRRRAQRVKRVRTASAEAAADDPQFAAEVVEPAAVRLFKDVQQAWDARDLAALQRLGGQELMEEWRLRLADFEKKGWHNRVKVRSGPEVEYVGLVNREWDKDDRVVVRVEADLDDYVVAGPRGREIYRNGRTTRATHLAEYWTLGKRDGGWVLLSIEQQAEGDHHLNAEIVASPWANDHELSDQTRVELAVADAASLPAGELVDVDLADDARAQALDLSLTDGRYDPELLVIAARRAVAGWVEAIDGADDALLAVASPEAAHALLYPGEAPGAERRRLVVRGVQVDEVRIEELDASQEPARMHVALQARGRRYVEDRSTAAVLSGSQSRETAFTERLVFALDGPAENPWRIVATG